MSLTEQASSFLDLDTWFNSPLGEHVAQAFNDELSHLSPLLYGDILLQLGSCGDNNWRHLFRFQHKWLATPFKDNNKTTFSTKLNQLPLDRSCIDCIIAPLTLDAFSFDTGPLDEIDRVLKPMGYVVFLGVTPLSLWGAWIRYAKQRCFGSLRGQPKSVHSIKKAMLHRGYLPCHLNVFDYIPPLNHAFCIDKLKVLNTIATMISPMPAGFYCLVMQKYVENELPPKAVSEETLWVKSSPAALRPVGRHQF